MKNAIVYNTADPNGSGSSKLLTEQMADALGDVLIRFSPTVFDSQSNRAHVRRFDNATLRAQLSAFVETTVASF